MPHVGLKLSLSQSCSSFITEPPVSVFSSLLGNYGLPALESGVVYLDASQSGSVAMPQWKDLSGHGNNFQTHLLYGIPVTLDTTNGGEFVFNNNFADSNLSLPSINSSNGFTWQFWVYPIFIHSVIFSSSISTTDFLRITCGTFNVSSPLGSAANTFSIPLNTWSCVTFIGNGTGLDIYINGAFSKSVTIPTRNGTLSPVLGYDPCYPSNSAAKIGSVLIYNTKLTAAQVATCYNATKSRFISNPTGNLTCGTNGYWNGNTCVCFSGYAYQGGSCQVVSTGSGGGVGGTS